MLRHSQITLGQLFEKNHEEEGENSHILDIKYDEIGGCWNITFLAEYRHRLFSDIAGVIALHHVNILSSELFTSKDGSVAEIFMKTRISDSIHPEDILRKLKRDLRNAYTGKLALPYRLNIKLLPPKICNSCDVLELSNVIVDNESSELFTQIQVLTRDRVGLLYRIINTLDDLRVLIRIANISTGGDKVKDIFYIHDLGGNKVEEGARVREIKKALMHQICLI